MPILDAVAGLGAGLRRGAGRPGRRAPAGDGADPSCRLHRPRCARRSSTHAMRGELPVLVTTPGDPPLRALDRRALPAGDGGAVAERDPPQGAPPHAGPGLSRAHASQDRHRARRPAGDGQAARRCSARTRSSSPPSRWTAGCASPAPSRTTRSISALCSPCRRRRRARSGWRAVAAHHELPAGCARPPARRGARAELDRPVAALGQALHQLYRFAPLAAAGPTAAQRPARRRQDGIGRQARRPRRARGPDGRGAEHRRGARRRHRAAARPARAARSSSPRRRRSRGACERLVGGAGSRADPDRQPGHQSVPPGRSRQAVPGLEMSGALPVLVLDAGTGSADSAEMAQTFAALGSRWLLATKLDVARRLGGVLAAADAGLALAEAGIGPTIGRGLGALSPAGLARLLMRGASGLDLSERCAARLRCWGEDAHEPRRRDRLRQGRGRQDLAGGQPRARAGAAWPAGAAVRRRSGSGQRRRPAGARARARSRGRADRPLHRRAGGAAVRAGRVRRDRRPFRLRAAGAGRPRALWRPCSPSCARSRRLRPRAPRPAGRHRCGGPAPARNRQFGAGADHRRADRDHRRLRADQGQPRRELPASRRSW